MNIHEYHLELLRLHLTLCPGPYRCPQVYILLFRRLVDPSLDVPQPPGANVSEVESAFFPQICFSFNLPLSE